MYSVYWLKDSYDKTVKTLLFAPNAGEDGYIITSGELTKGINIAGNLTLTIPRTNPVWRHPIFPGELGEIISVSVLNRGDIITVEKTVNGVVKEIWRGRVSSQSWDIYQTMNVVCEGTLAYLNDLLLPDYNFYWSGIIMQSYNPDEGLSSANLDKLKDFLPNLNLDGITDSITDVVNDVISSDSFSVDQSSFDTTMNNALTTSDGNDNVDRRVTVYDFLVWVLTMYNVQLSQDIHDKRKQIKIGYIDPVFQEDEYKINHKTTQYTVIWDAISEAVLDVFGGVLYISNWYKNESGEMVYDEVNSYLYYYRDRIGECSQMVQFGENLLNYNYEVDQTERVSRWYIFGKTKDSSGNEILLDMSSVNHGLKYVGASESWIGTVSRAEYTDLTSPKELYDYGLKKYKQSFWGSYKISVDAIDLSVIDHTIDEFEPGTAVQVLISNEIESTKRSDFMLESMTLNLLSPESSTYTFTKTGLEI